MSWRALVIGGALAALAGADFRTLEKVQRPRAEGTPWAEIGQALIVSDATGACLDEVRAPRRQGMTWERVRRKAGARPAPAEFVPKSRDEEQLDRRGFQAPADSRRRAPGQATAASS